MAGQAPPYEGREMPQAPPGRFRCRWSDGRAYTQLRIGEDWSAAIVRNKS